LKCVGIDYGLARVGLAVSDPEGRIAFPLDTLHMSSFPDRGAMLDAIARRIADEGAEAVVMGLPVLADGGVTTTTRQVVNATRRLKRRVPLPFYYASELLSSETAWSDLRDAGCPPERRRAVLDSHAAACVLQTFLDASPEDRRMA
jgi:putative Holliday junction resolvase